MTLGADVGNHFRRWLLVRSEAGRRRPPPPTSSDIGQRREESLTTVPTRPELGWWLGCRVNIHPLVLGAEMKIGEEQNRKQNNGLINPRQDSFYKSPVF